ncbi:MAG: MG2 domain-containing protein [Bacteroidota bacterium]
MKKTHIAYVSAIGLLCLLAGSLFFSDTVADYFSPPTFEVPQELQEHITAFTAGEISRKSPIQLRFAENQVDNEQIGTVLTQSLFSFEPPIKGTASWVDKRTLAFIPDELLPSGQVYEAEVKLKHLLDDLPSSARKLRFRFGTRHQNFDVALTKTQILHNGQQQWHQLQGVIRTVDIEEQDMVEKLFSAHSKDVPVQVRWEHKPEERKHHFVIDSLPRKEVPYLVRMFWDGNKVGIKQEGKQEVLIPPTGKFRHLHTYAYQEPDQYVVLEFSDPLKVGQSLEGLVRIDGHKARITQEENRIKIFPSSSLSEAATIRLEAGIQSLTGSTLDAPYVESIEFEEAKPKVRLIGKGSIVPQSETMPFVFESIGLNAVDVRVIRVFEKNIPQFLQVNQLSGSKELKRVGQMIAQTTLDLTTQTQLDLNTWNRHAIDLGTIINPDPGAIYEVAIGFRRSYSRFACEDEGSGDSDPMLEIGEDWHTFTSTNEDSYWDWWDEDYDSGYRSDPCYNPYYHPGRIARRMVLASNFGLIAKQGDAGAFIAVTDLKTTEPISGVNLEIYDYQHQLITSLSTDSKGQARTQFDNKPYLLVAKKGNQRGYLRMDDGSSLSMSRFDTKGKTSYKGVKGFLYAERGVWRPGDHMYINFILEDKQGQLPVEHPVQFTLTDPRGQTVERRVQTQGLNGFYAFPTKTSADAPTGNYAAEVKIGGATFRKTFKVETVIPNRLKMDLDFGVPYLSTKTTDREADLEAKWLHGAVANQLKADVRVRLEKSSTSFPKYSEFVFDDPVGEYSTEEMTLFDGKLDPQGIAKIPAKIHAEDGAPGKLTANFKTKVFEPGGAFSVDRFSIPYHPYQTYVGLRTPKGDAARNMLLTDVDHKIELVSLNPDGQPVSSKVDVTLYKLSWKWWWDKSEDNIGIYNGKVEAEELQTATVATTNGKGTWNMNVKYPQWGRYLVRATDQNGHSSGKIVYIDWPGWAGRSTEREGGGAQMLNFTAEKQLYNVGEDITLNIPTGDAGRALVSIETENKVLDAYWVNATKGTTRFTFPSTVEMTPNVYVNVTLLQPHAQTKNDLPIRMYGVIPLKVEDPTTHLKPVLTMADELKPNNNFAVKVSEATGQPMTYTVAVVDEGLLGLTRYKAPDPWNTFYQRLALDVKTWDVYDQVLGAYGGEIKSLLSIGGGAGEEGPDGQKANRFKPVVMHLGPFELEAGKTATHNLKMPNYIGAVRTMIVAGDPKGAYGATEKSTPVKQPLMVMGTLPRVLGPGERVKMPVTVFALEDQVKVVNVSVETGKKVMVEGGESKTVRFYEVGEKMTDFDLGVLSSMGATPIKITARSGNEIAVYETEIEVRNPNPRITKVHTKTLDKGASWTQAFRPVGMSGTNRGVIEVSSLPPISLGKRLEYLLRYPYGCIEQTTSSVFPQVYVSNLLDLKDAQKKKVEKNLRAGIERLKLFQTAGGGFAYWPGQTETNDWGTNYAGHFLIEVEKAGYSLPEGMLNKWAKHQKGVANKWEGSKAREELTQAYRLYLLALAGKAELGAMNRLQRKTSLNNVAKWQLAAAYYMAGQKDMARKLTNGLSKTASTYQELGGTYGSTLRDQAIILEALSVMDQRDKVGNLVTTISNKLSSQDWLNTQATAYSLVAMARYAGEGSNDSKMKFAWRIKGGKWQEISTSSPYWQIDLTNVRKSELELKNKGGGMLFPRLILDGIPLQGDTSRAAYGLTMEMVYMTMGKLPVNPAELEQGTDFQVKVSVKNTGNRDYFEMALNQIFPSGWEIHNARLDGVSSGSVPEYQDIRDDRIYTFFDLKQNESKTFYVLLNASYLGRYYLPSVSVEAMYDRSIHAHQPGQWVVVE